LRNTTKVLDIGGAKNILGLLESGNEPVYEYDIRSDGGWY